MKTEDKRQKVEVLDKGDEANEEVIDKKISRQK